MNIAPFLYFPLVYSKDFSFFQPFAAKPGARERL